MKTANLLSISAFVFVSATLASVGCTTPAASTLPGGDSTSADSAKNSAAGDDDDSSSNSNSSSSTSSSTPTPTSTTTTTDGGAGTASLSSAACTTCVASNAQMKAFVACAAACAPTDDTCNQSCWTQSGCSDSANEAACEQMMTTCGTQCDPGGDDDDSTTTGTGTGDDDDDGAACEACVQKAGNAKTTSYIQCSVSKCDSATSESAFETCDNQCWEQSGCASSSAEKACDAVMTTCEQQCGDDDDDDSSSSQ